MPTDPTTAWVSASQAARDLDVHHSTVATWCARGFIAAARQPGPRGRFRIPVSEVERMWHLLVAAFPGV